MKNAQGYERDIRLGVEHHFVTDETVTSRFIVDMAYDYETETAQVCADMRSVATQNDYRIRFEHEAFRK